MSDPKFKMGDHVRVTTSKKTGYVKSVFDAYAWGMWTGFAHEYTIEFDDGSEAINLVEGVLEPYDLTLPTGIRCECGSSSVGVQKHSDYCPIYDPNS